MKLTAIFLLALLLNGCSSSHYAGTFWMVIDEVPPAPSIVVDLTSPADSKTNGCFQILLSQAFWRQAVAPALKKRGIVRQDQSSPIRPWKQPTEFRRGSDIVGEFSIRIDGGDVAMLEIIASEMASHLRRTSSRNFPSLGEHAMGKWPNKRP